jgi:predicted RecA/RadA family phage recombinase
MAREIYTGDVITNYIAQTDLVQGQMVAVGSFTGIAINTVNTGEVVTLQIKGVFEFPAEQVTDADEIVVGSNLYQDATGDKVTTDATSGVFIGISLTAKPANTIGQIDLMML